MNEPTYTPLQRRLIVALTGAALLTLTATVVSLLQALHL
jgi:hypothetical protein